MRWFFGLLLCCMLCSCGIGSVSHEIANGAIQQATAIEQSLPKECATEAVKAQIAAIKTQITAITQACDTEKDKIKAEKVKWMTAFFGLLIAIVVFIIRKVMK